MKITINFRSTLVHTCNQNSNFKILEFSDESKILRFQADKVEIEQVQTRKKMKYLRQ